ncbi:MAG TPA: hypothetical protein VEH08_05630 [Methanomassiliicoccales archaeon]|nr:hypothetical protein [Methanomassiliicoccales archaeon]
MGSRNNGDERLLRLGWFSSGREGSAELLAPLLDTLQRKSVEAVIAFVFCNWEKDEEPDHANFRDRQKLFELAHSGGIPLVTFSWKRFRESRTTGTKEDWKKEYGSRLRALFSEHQFDVGVLAGYTLSLDDETMERFELLSLNCSPPGGISCGLEEGILKAITLKAESYGCSVNHVRPDWDVSLPIAICTFRLRTPENQELWRDYELWAADRSADLLPKAEIEGKELFVQLRKDARRRQSALIATVVQMFAAGKLEMRKGKVYEDGRPLTRPYDLTPAVEGAIAAREF